jgi:hypothetical protein
VRAVAKVIVMMGCIGARNELTGDGCSKHCCRVGHGAGEKAVHNIEPTTMPKPHFQPFLVLQDYNSLNQNGACVSGESDVSDPFLPSGTFRSGDLDDDRGTP